MKNFALIGAAGFVAPRHMRAIHDTGNRLIAAVDPHDSVGILDSYFPETHFFTSTERFERFLARQRRSEQEHVDYVSVCSPNYLHDSHIRMALWMGADAICEKPLVINPWNLDELETLQEDTGRRVYTILQLRRHPALIALKERLDREANNTQPTTIRLTYVTRRGNWYTYSWKGNAAQSGGVAMNIGVHFFDLLMWLFGGVERSAVYLSEPNRMAGHLDLQRASVEWYLSIDGADLPEGYLDNGRYAYRSIVLNDEELEFSEGFTDLHTRVYEDILTGGGSGISDARPSIELIHQMNTGRITPPTPCAHPMIPRRGA